MPKKYQSIRQTPAFKAAYSDIRLYLRRSSPLAYLALPSAMETVLDVIDGNPRAWPIKRTHLDDADFEFHLAVVDIAYRRLHIRYYVDAENCAYLAAIWVDGNDEPNYSSR